MSGRRGDVTRALLALCLLAAGWGIWATGFQGREVDDTLRHARALVLPAALHPRTVAVLPCQVTAVEQFTGYQGLTAAELADAHADVFVVPAGARHTLLVPGCAGAQVGTGGRGNVGAGGQDSSVLGPHHIPPTANAVTAWLLPTLRGDRDIHVISRLRLPEHQLVRTVLVPRCTGRNQGAGAGGARQDVLALQGTTAIAPPCDTGAG